MFVVHCWQMPMEGHELISDEELNQQPFKSLILLYADQQQYSHYVRPKLEYQIC